MPRCIVKPRDVVDVSRIMRAVASDRQESTAKCKFAIRGGGHMMWAGAANVAGGVTIDLSAMNAVSVNAARGVTSVGAGAIWLDVYMKLDALGLAVAGGRDSNVGVAGLTLGGGLSYFAPRYGFVCDNVVNFEVVLASSKAVNANATFNPDLFFALKGGSNNFGLVTRFDFKTFEQSEIWAGTIGYDFSTRSQQLEAFSRFTDTNNNDPYAAVIHAYAWMGDEQDWIISNSYAYTKTHPYPAILDDFMGIKPQRYNSMRKTRMTDLAVEMDASNPRGERQLYVTVTVSNNAALLAEIFNIADALLQPINRVSGLRYAIAYQAIPTTMMTQSIASGGNALGLDRDSGNLVLIFLNISWRNFADDTAINNQATFFVEQVERKADLGGILHRWKYLNYAAQWQDPIAGYGDTNKEKLRAASRKYDPDQFFQTQVPGGFKLH
ncbi:hypothetical protein MMC13_001581 [Lambiella insularis]|nr:hypothetical protein [Lambiella insularis]